MLIKKKDLIKMLAADSNVSMTVAKNVFDSLTAILEDIAISGNTVRLNNLGRTTFINHKAKEERIGVINPKTGEKGTLPAKESFSVPTMKYFRTIINRVKEESKGSPFDK